MQKMSNRIIVLAQEHLERKREKNQFGKNKVKTDKAGL